MWAYTLCPMCCKHKVILCSFIFSVNVVCFAEGSLRGLALVARGRKQHLSHLSVGKCYVLFMHTCRICCSWHRQQVLSWLRCSRMGYHQGMHDHHCLSCHLPCKHVSADAIHTGSAEQEGRPDFLVCSIKPREKKNTESHYDEKSNVEVMQRLNHFSQRTTGEIMSSNYPRWRTDSEEVIITANGGWNWAND